MIEIDTINFTPLPSLIGGLLIGLSIIIFFISTGRLAGVSGIINNVLNSNEHRISNLLFLLGLVMGPILYNLIIKREVIFSITSSIPLIIIGGLLVGIGTKIGSGCTSGHGICGISRLSLRSICATIIFIFFAMIAVFFLKFF